MIDWLLLLPYLGVQLCLLALFWLTGRALRWNILGPSFLRSNLLTFIWDYCLGLLTWSLLITWTGLSHLLIRPVVALAVLVVLILSIGSLLRHWPLPTFAIRWRVPAFWQGRFGRARVLVVAYFCGIAALIVVASAAPDMSQDSMWYHLSVPRAWTFSGTIAGSPSNMPSNYALGMEVLYAALLLFGSEIHCSMLYGQVAIVLLLAIPALAHEAFGRRAGWIAAALTPTVFCAATLLVPVLAVNDFAAMLPMLLAMLGAADHQLLPCDLRRHTVLNPSLEKRAGLFLGAFVGGALAIKILTGGFLLPFLAVLVLRSLVQSRRASSPVPVLLFWFGMCASALEWYLPWGARNVIMGCGNPLFPFGQHLIPHNAAFDAIVDQSARLNSLFPPTPAGLLAAIQDLPAKASRFLRTDGTMVVCVLLAAPVCLLRRGLLRWIGVALLLQLAMLLMMRGKLELVRYFTLCYPAALIAISALAAQLWNARPDSRRLLTPGIALVALTGIASHAFELQKWNSFPPVAWPGHPVLTDQSRRAYAFNKEPGGALLPLFEQVARRIPVHATVLLPDCHYPFYLNRRCVWGCEVSPPILQTVWHGLDARGAEDWMRTNGVNFIVLMAPPADERLKAMIAAGRLREALPPARDTRFTLRVFELSPADPAVKVAL